MNILNEIKQQKKAIKNSVIHMASNGLSYPEILKSLVVAYANPYFTLRVTFN